MRRICVLLSFLILLAVTPVVKANEDDTFQTWYQAMIWWRVDPSWSLGVYGDLRVTDGFGDVYAHFVSPRIRYDVNKNLQLQMNASWIDAFNADATVPIDSFRLEFEANPILPLSDHLVFSMRNRFEWRWIEGDVDYNTRLRVRPQLDWLIRKQGLFRGFFINYETFWDFDQSRITETRLVPFGVILKPTDQLELRLSYLWRQTVGADGWYGYHGAVATATFTF